MPPSASNTTRIVMSFALACNRRVDVRVGVVSEGGLEV
jgi:hypothetical protein